MATQKSISKKKSPKSKKNGFPSAAVFAILALGIGLLATQFQDPTPVTANIRRWFADREILRKTELMGGHIYSYDPLVIYLPNFLNMTEIEYLKEMGERLAAPSLVLGNNEQKVDLKTRSSKSATLPFADPIVRDVAERSQHFQGYNDISHLESLQVVSYGISDHFMHHFDYIQEDSELFEAHGYNRDTTMLVYLEDACTGGGTNFPELPIPTGEALTPFWANVLDLNDTNTPGGATFKPVAGAAIFWRNLDATGEGIKEVVHAGLPVKSGHKSAVNIWTAQGPMKGDAWSGLVCLDDTGNTYDCPWDDPKARPGVPIEYSGNYWIQEGEAYQHILSQKEGLLHQIEALEGLEGTAGEKKELQEQIKELDEAFVDGRAFLESVKGESKNKQPELEKLIKRLDEWVKKR